MQLTEELKLLFWDLCIQFKFDCLLIFLFTSTSEKLLARQLGKRVRCLDRQVPATSDPAGSSPVPTHLYNQQGDSCCISFRDHIICLVGWTLPFSKHLSFVQFLQRISFGSQMCWTDSWGNCYVGVSWVTHSSNNVYLSPQ